MDSSTEDAASKMAEKMGMGSHQNEVQLGKETEVCFYHQKTLRLNKHFQQIIGIQNQQIKISSFPTCQWQINQERSILKKRNPPQKKNLSQQLKRSKYQKINPTRKKWFEEFEEDSRPREDLPRSQFNIVKRIFHQK